MIGNSRRKNPSVKQNYNQTSPTKASISIQTDCTEYVRELQAKKESTEQCLKLYKQKFQANEPQKCIRHIQDFISLYCQQEKKLMCVNCLYGSTQHKNHKVSPLNTCWDSIEADNEESLIYLKDEFEKLKKTESELQSNFKMLNKEYENLIKQLERQFNQIHRLIDQKHDQMKDRIINQFNQSLKNTDISLKEITWRKNYYSQIGSSFPRKNSSNHQSQIYKHLVMELLMSQPIQAQKLTYLASSEQLHEQYLHDATQLSGLVKSNLQTDTQSTQKSSQRRKY